MNIGQLRHKVTFYNVTEVSDGQGGQVETEVPLAENLPCAVEALSKTELLAAGQVIGESTHKITIRGRTDINSAQRALVTYSDTGQSQKMEIEGVHRGDERGRETHVFCTIRA